jgi:hypothetical protein
MKYFKFIKKIKKVPKNALEVSIFSLKLRGHVLKLSNLFVGKFRKVKNGLKNEDNPLEF